MKGKIIIHKHKTGEVYQKAGELLMNYLKLYHNITKKTLLLLSGGSAVELYKPLAEFIKESDLDFSFLSIGQVDERFFHQNNNVIASPQAWRSRYDSEQHRGLLREAPSGSSLRPIGFRNDDNSNINSILIGQTGLWKICDEKKIPYYLVSQEGTLSESSDEYNNVLEKLFKENIYKIAVMGIGGDGHTAGLLPGYLKHWNTANLVAGYENSGEFKQRISITPIAIKLLDQVIVAASGEKKMEVIKHLTFNIKHLTKNTLNKFPAIILRKVPQVDLFTGLE